MLGFSLNEVLLLDRGIPQRKALRKKVLNISEGGSVIYRKRLFNKVSQAGTCFLYIFSMQVQCTSAESNQRASANTHMSGVAPVVTRRSSRIYMYIYISYVSIKREREREGYSMSNMP